MLSKDRLEDKRLLCLWDNDGHCQRRLHTQAERPFAQPWQTFTLHAAFHIHLKRGHDCIPRVVAKLPDLLSLPMSRPRCMVMIAAFLLLQALAPSARPSYQAMSWRALDALAFRWEEATVSCWDPPVAALSPPPPHPPSPLPPAPLPAPRPPAPRRPPQVSHAVSRGLCVLFSEDIASQFTWYMPC